MNKASTMKRPAVVHESEVQRQHVRIQIPAAIRIGKQTYRLHNLSAGGFCIKSDKNFAVGETEKEGLLLFPFESFSFNLKVKIVHVYSNAEKKLSGFRFEETTPRQISLLQHIIKSYLAGLLTSEEELIAIAGRDNHALPRKKESNDNYTNGVAARVFPVLLIAVATFLGLFFIAGNVYEKTSVVKSYVGIVEGNIFTARAEENGEFYSLLAKGAEQVTKGQPIAAIKQGATPGTAIAGKNVTIESPCDCLIVQQFPQDGEFIAMGEPLFRLQPVNDYLWVTASLKPEQVHRLRLQDTAHIKIAGENEFIEGNITEFLTPSLEKEVTGVKIRTRKAIPSSLTGRLAYVEFIVH